MTKKKQNHHLGAEDRRAGRGSPRVRVSTSPASVSGWGGEGQTWAMPGVWRSLQMALARAQGRMVQKRREGLTAWVTNQTEVLG